MATNIFQFRDMVRSDIKNLGLYNTLYDLFYRAANRLLLFRVLRCMAIGIVDSTYLKGSEKFNYSFLSEDMLYEFTKNEETEISVDFLNQALKNGDMCYGILDGNKLASYGWY